MLGFRPVHLGAMSRSRRRLEGGSAIPLSSAPTETAKSDNVGSLGPAAFPDVAWLFVVLSLQPRLEEGSLRECLRQLERRFNSQRVPDSYVAGVRQAAALLAAGIAKRSEGVEAVPLLDINQRLVLSNELLNVDTRWVLEGIDRSLPGLKLTSRSISGLTDAELTDLGCTRAWPAVLERLPPGFCPQSIPCSEAGRVVTLIRSEAFMEGLRRLFVHGGLSERLSPSERDFLNMLEVTMVQELPLRVMYEDRDVTRPNRAGSIHHLEANVLYLCNRDAAPFSKFLPALAFRLRQGLGVASGRPIVSIRQRILVAILRQEDPAKIPGLVDDMISGDSPDRVRTPKRHASISLESTPMSKVNITRPPVLEIGMGGVSLLRKLGGVAKDLCET